MAGSNNFTATIQGWKIQTEEAIDLVVKAAAQEIASLMVLPVPEGGRMRVDTGFLRNSLTASTEEMPKIDPGAKPAPDAGKGSYPPPDVSMVILGADLKKTPIYIGFTASYAVPREYGARGAPPDGFVRMNAKKWPKLIDRFANEFGVK